MISQRWRELRFIDLAKKRHSTRKYVPYRLTEDDKEAISGLLCNLSSLE
ncbi:MAG: hypothetical protein XE05_0988 [Thermotogales bacterium 46_20]|nr:MAG: hypothetical protein XE05_0988 [Thermotogales bacterium 46_20]